VTTQPAAADEQRRRIVLAVTVVLGAAVTAWALRIEPGDPLFYWGTLAMAVMWLGGAAASRTVTVASLRGDDAAREARQGLALGGLLLGLFVVGAFVIAAIPPLLGPVEGLLAHAEAGVLPLVVLVTAVNGLAEEVFFRGALFEVVRRNVVLVTTGIYAAVTVVGGVPLLVLAGLLLGLATGRQREVTGGIVAPVVTHLVWSLGMLLLLPGTLSLAKGLWG
jgi:membrane protease YdiL (CAAX protease family)